MGKTYRHVEHNDDQEGATLAPTAQRQRAQWIRHQRQSRRPYGAQRGPYDPLYTGRHATSDTLGATAKDRGVR